MDLWSIELLVTLLVLLVWAVPALLSRVCEDVVLRRYLQCACDKHHAGRLIDFKPLYGSMDPEWRGLVRRERITCYVATTSSGAQVDVALEGGLFLGRQIKTRLRAGSALKNRQLAAR